MRERSTVHVRNTEVVYWPKRGGGAGTTEMITDSPPSWWLDQRIERGGGLVASGVRTLTDYSVARIGWVIVLSRTVVTRKLITTQSPRGVTSIRETLTKTTAMEATATAAAVAAWSIDARRYRSDGTYQRRRRHASRSNLLLNSLK